MTDYNIKSDLYTMRPNASVNSINQYASTLTKLYSYIYEGKMISLEWVADLDIIEQVEQFLDTYSAPTKRNYLNSIIVALKGLNEYDEDLLKTYETLRDTYHQEYLASQSQLTPKQKENWASWKDIVKVVTRYKDSLTTVLTDKPEEIHPSEYKTFNDYVLLLLYTKLPPIRNDFGNVRIIKHDNFATLEKKHKSGLNLLVVRDNIPQFLVLNEYKTHKTYGEVQIPLPEEVKTVVTVWLKYNKSGYLLVGGRSKSQPLGSNGISVRLRAIFKKYLNKNISTNMLRHIYVSERYSTTVDAMKKDANDMLHDEMTQKKIYVKTYDH
tara:strand:- start:6737 stop:7711 length:975 start_codon:yes stop_codon:yes gene_type:complete